MQRPLDINVSSSRASVYVILWLIAAGGEQAYPYAQLGDDFPSQCGQYFG